MVHPVLFNQNAYFGRGAIAEVPNCAKSMGLTKAFIVTGPVLTRVGTVAKVTDLLDAAGVGYVTYTDIAPNPPIEDITKGVAAFKASGADFIIGLGGGSPQDACKAIGIIAANPEFADVSSLEGLSPTKNPSVPIFGIPTTAGSASETTDYYVVTDEAAERKWVAVDPHCMPIVAFVDPDLMDGMPRHLKVASGLDCLTHAIESYINPDAWALTEALSKKSFELTAANLAKSADGDKVAGEMMGYSSFIAGMAFSNVGLGLVHSMAHQLGGRLGVDHGEANGILLAKVMEFNKEFTGEKYRDIANAFGVADAYTGELASVREEAITAVHDFALSLGNPATISEVGAKEEDLQPLAEAAFIDACLPGNPRKPTVEEIRGIYASLM
ncbi:MAG: iron-containing alcohol dehydrogenase [Bifidobacteriaceae bacterium]|jgi:lactaldehyde reductase|nr:iron-containing alcohol dehydrogenase [Bifidobacteriaceae bacterium]MCI1914741.1 iron-containing alcohol dehydrogenase [Bifidobacteriaceae bacterium]